jgi:formyl-CoA transferase/CoA:oxalate CoA-transferase
MVGKTPPPLQGVRVLDLSRVIAGPLCSMILADLGAEVIKVEIPGRGDDTRGYPPYQKGESSYFMSLNRNKKSITLNLKDPKGREAIHRLIPGCHVVLENYRPGVTEKLEVDYETLRQINPSIVYASISSFGQTGPYNQLPGYDLIIQGMGGLMALTGEPTRPPIRIGVAVTDMGASMWTAIAILAALKSVEKDGQGQYIDISLLHGSIAWLTYAAGNYFATGRNPPKMASAHPSIVPYQAFMSGDGRYLLLAAGNDKLFQKLCEGMDVEELAADPLYSTNRARVKNRERLIPRLQKEFLKHSRDEWIQSLRSIGVPCGPVYNLDEIFKDPHIKKSDLIVEVEHPRAGVIKQIRSPIKLSHTPLNKMNPPPMLGEHTEEILKKYAKYTDVEIRTMREKGII